MDDLVPSIRQRGILQPLLVKPRSKANHYEIYAGRRRFFAMKETAKAEDTVPTLPCWQTWAGRRIERDIQKGRTVGTAVTSASADDQIGPAKHDEEDAQTRPLLVWAEHVFTKVNGQGSPQANLGTCPHPSVGEAIRLSADCPSVVHPLLLLLVLWQTPGP